MSHRIGRSSSNGLQYFFLYQTWDERHSLNLCYVTRCSMEPSLILLLWSILHGVHYHIRLIIGHLHNTHYNSWLCHPLIKTALASICCKLDFSPFLSFVLFHHKTYPSQWHLVFQHHRCSSSHCSLRGLAHSIVHTLMFFCFKAILPKVDCLTQLMNCGVSKQMLLTITIVL